MKEVRAKECKRGHRYVLYYGDVDWHISEDVTDCIDTYYEKQKSGEINERNEEMFYIVDETDDSIVIDW